MNKGVAADFFPDDPFPEVGQCVHKLLVHPARPERLWQQNHCGVYRSDDRGDNWERLEGNGLPSGFGFPLALDHARPRRGLRDPGGGRREPRHAERATRRLPHPRRRRHLGAADRRPAAAGLGLGAARGDVVRPARPGRRSTSARRAARCSPHPTAATRGSRPRATCRPILSVEACEWSSSCFRSSWPREAGGQGRFELEAATVREALRAAARPRPALRRARDPAPTRERLRQPRAGRRGRRDGRGRRRDPPRRRRRGRLAL